MTPTAVHQTASDLYADLDIIAAKLAELSEHKDVSAADGDGLSQAAVLVSRAKEAMHHVTCLGTLTPEQANDELRFALNELRAIGTAEQRDTDRKTCANRLRKIVSHIESGGDFPTVEEVIKEASTISIQG